MKVQNLSSIPLSNIQVAGIRARLINVLLDENDVYSLDHLMRDTGVSKHEIMTIKSSYFTNRFDVDRVLCWLEANEREYREFFSHHQRLHDYQVIDFH
jgi:hypothetical protein